MNTIIRYINSLFSKIIIVFFVSLLMLPSASTALAEETEIKTKDARPSQDGMPHVEGTYLVNKQGEPVMLRGISTHGLAWYPDYINEDLFRQISEEWNCNIIRLAMYSEDYIANKKENLQILYRGIEAAIKADMYVLVDWHILNDSDPMINIEEAKIFFEEVSSRYPDHPNLIYEICNEPNGDTVWDSIYEYAETVIPIIRKNSQNALIVVGTPEYDQDLESPLQKRIDDPNLMYVFHFYTASHYETMHRKLEAAVQAGLPVFISECGVSEADGDGRIDFEGARSWFAYLHEQKISYIIWNLSNKNESSSFIKASSSKTRDLKEEDLTYVGKWVRSLLQGTDPEDIPVYGTVQDYSFKEKIMMHVAALGSKGLRSTHQYGTIFCISGALTLLGIVLILRETKNAKQRFKAYDDIHRDESEPADIRRKRMINRAIIYLSSFFTLIYLIWRIFYSLSFHNGILAVIANLILLAVEMLGFIESFIHYYSLTNLRSHPLPEIEEAEYPDVDIFIATYNEPEELLYRTINGCRHLDYPDKNKVHIWVCDDNRRPQMRKLAQKMDVGYFDRPDNKGAKAGNLNHALSLTDSPYVVTLDADMIVKSDFLLKTIPYFVDAEKRNEGKDENEQIHLGLLQTPQCFYDPDVFQHALYSETRIPNEQDFFYRSIEVARTSNNSVIYGGSNTVLSRKALESIGGFFTETITEDFATGMLIEDAGYVSLGLGEPLASGRTPHTYKEHIQQRSRWGRGVISSERKLDLKNRKGLSLSQKLSYWSSVIYWYSPIKNLVYITSPLLYALFSIPVFRCNWLEILEFWLPMFVFQELCLRIVSNNLVSGKWSGIYETSVMPHLLIPIIKEAFGINESKFKVTDKTKKEVRKTEFKWVAPFFALILLSLAGIIRIFSMSKWNELVTAIPVLFWLFRNLYFLIMAVFLVDGRDSDDEVVKVKDGEFITVQKKEKGKTKDYSGITTLMTEHSVKMILDDSTDLKIGDNVTVQIQNAKYEVSMKGVVIDVLSSRFNEQRVHTIEILNKMKNDDEYLQILYDRIPTLPQGLQRDLGFFPYLWRNIVQRAARANKL